MRISSSSGLVVAGSLLSRRWGRVQSRLCALYLRRVRAPVAFWYRCGRPASVPRLPWWHQFLYSWLRSTGALRSPPCRSPWSPAGQRWLAEQRTALRAAREYLLWSEAEWAVRSAALPWARRRRFFTRGPV